MTKRTKMNPTGLAKQAAPVDADERERIRRDYKRLRKIEEKEREAEREKDKCRERELTAAAETRLALLRERLDCLGIGHLIKVDIQKYRWSEGINWPDIRGCIAGTYAEHEAVLGELLDRLEALAGGTKAKEG